jgi:hypothetical protein
MADKDYTYHIALALILGIVVWYVAWLLVTL